MHSHIIRTSIGPHLAPTGQTGQSPYIDSDRVKSKMELWAQEWGLGQGVEWVGGVGWRAAQVIDSFFVQNSLAPEIGRPL